MTEEFDTILPEDESSSDDFGSAFDAMESEINADLPEGSFVTLRSGANAPRYAPIYEGENGAPIKVLADRAGLTFGGSIDIYVDGSKVNFDYVVPAGAVVTFVGNVKGGSVIS
jgi:hypothetical protein